MSRRITEWIEAKIEGVLKLSINKEKTGIAKINKCGNQLNFLGFTFREDNDLQGRPWKYLNIFPAKKAIDKFKESLREELGRNGIPVSMVIEKINQKTRGWKEYFKYGSPRNTFRDVNFFLQGQFKSFLRRRSQRKCKIRRNGESHYAALKRCGLVYL